MTKWMNRSIAFALSSFLFVAPAAQAFGFKTLFFGMAAAAAAKHGLAKVNESKNTPGMPNASGSFDGCRDQFPNNTPFRFDQFNASYKLRPLCFDSFAVLHSGLTKTPLVSIEKLNLARMDAAHEPRTDRFFEDARLPSAERAHLIDYKNNALDQFDRGHMSPAGDMPNPNAMAQSFSLANMVPQDPTNNRKIWVKIEKDVRKYAKRAPGDTFVFSGPLFLSQGGHTIGPGKVWVPEKLFKLVYNQSTGKTFGYILDNTSTAQIGRPLSYAEFVQQTKFDPLKGIATTP